MPSKDIAKVSENVDDDTPSSGSEDLEDSHLEEKRDSSETLNDCAMDSINAAGLIPACEEKICVDVVGNDVLAELSNPSEGSDKLTDELISASTDNDANNKA